MEIICKNCGSVNDYTTELKNGQNVATCSCCDRFIKNVPYQPPKFYFGKYKNQLISENIDLNYLEWFLHNTKPKANIKEAVIKQINIISDRINEQQKYYHG